jgi:hypothetical protein
MPKNDKYKDYARYAERCLNMVAASTDRESRSIQREMAAEWLRLADAIRRKQMQMGWCIQIKSSGQGGPPWNPKGAIGMEKGRHPKLVITSNGPQMASINLSPLGRLGRFRIATLGSMAVKQAYL